MRGEDCVELPYVCSLIEDLIIKDSLDRGRSNESPSHEFKDLKNRSLLECDKLLIVGQSINVFVVELSEEKLDFLLREASTVYLLQD